jgi:hypothetical protein
MELKVFNQTLNALIERVELDRKFGAMPGGFRRALFLLFGTK